MVSSTACSVSHSYHLRDSTAAVLFLTKCNIVHFVTNSNWDDFFNACLPSRGWCKPRRVGSDPWYHDMIAFGVVVFSCRTLGFGFTFSCRTKDHSQAKSNCTDVDDLSESKEKMQKNKFLFTLLLYPANLHWALKPFLSEITDFVTIACIGLTMFSSVE